jgi:hypothetical protein
MLLHGVYEVNGAQNVHLIEITIDHPPEKVDVGKITQEIQGEDKESWQSPWDEKYLNEEGDEVIGEFFDVPKGTDTTRLAFFFHHLNLNTPLLTPYGQLDLPKPTKMPDRLVDIIEYESPD